MSKRASEYRTSQQNAFNSSNYTEKDVQEMKEKLLKERKPKAGNIFFAIILMIFIYAFYFYVFRKLR